MCSELVLKSYETVDHTPTLQIPFTTVMGKPVVPPNAFCRRFDDEYGTSTPQLDYVAFLDGDEQANTAFVRQDTELRKSWRRPKWHIVAQNLG